MIERDYHLRRPAVTEVTFPTNRSTLNLKNDRQQAEVGVLDNEHHKLSVQIRKMAPNVVTKLEYPTTASASTGRETGATRKISDGWLIWKAASCITRS